MFDQRWQFVLGNLGTFEAPFSQGTLVDFRNRLIRHDLDRKLLDRTVEIAQETEGFGWKKLNAAFDSSPLNGCGRVEDTWNLLGRAMDQLVRAISHALLIPAEQCRALAGVTLLGSSSLKATLDLDWDDPEQRLAIIALPEDKDRAQNALNKLDQIEKQDIEPDPEKGGVRILQGVAPDRLVSLGDPEMKHGRKSRAKRFNGYKRQIARLVDIEIIVGASVIAANRRDHEAAPELLASVKRHGELEELSIDRAYLSSEAIVEEVEKGLKLNCKPWPSRNRGLFTKDDFKLDLTKSEMTCPAGVKVEFNKGDRLVKFPAEKCGGCPLREKCTRAGPDRGRGVSVHEHEDLLQNLKEVRKTAEGRANLRKRTVLEHSLARVGRIQGTRARYKGTRRNTLDLRRTAVVANLQTLSRLVSEGTLDLAA